MKIDRALSQRPVVHSLTRLNSRFIQPGSQTHEKHGTVCVRLTPAAAAGLH